MRTIISLIEEIIDITGDWSDDNGEVKDLIEVYTQEIRKDQDKITRHACAISLNDLEMFVHGQKEQSMVLYDEAWEAIINTKAI